MHILIIELEAEDVLAGKGRGALLLSKLIPEVERRERDLPASVRESGEPEPLFLDFMGVRVATGSYLRAGVVGFRDYCRNAGLRLYPVVANATPETLDDLSQTLEQMGEGFLVCELVDGSPERARVLGTLEAKQRLTLDAVAALGEVDATKLANSYKEEEIGITGWNNRLASLVAKGLLMETKKGRGKMYRPVLEIC